MTAFAIISLVMSVIMAGAGIYAQYSANQQNIEQNNLNREDTQEFNAQEAEKARQANIEQYNLLYSPQAKVQQYREAGLSPALMYSGGGAASAGGTAQMASAGMAGTPTINPIIPQGGLYDLLNQASEMEKRQKESENIGADTDLKEQEIDNLKNTINVQNAEIEKIISEKNLNNVKVQNEAFDGVLKQYEIDYTQRTQENRISLVAETLQNLKNKNDELLQTIEGLKIDNANKQKLYDAQLKKYAAETSLLWKQGALTDAQTAVAKAEEKLKNSEKALTDYQKNLVGKEIEKINKLIPQIEAQTDLFVKQGEKIQFDKVSECVGWITDVANSAANVIKAVKGF